MRIDLFISMRNREVWERAKRAAKADSTSLSDLVACALREFLSRRERQLARATARAEAAGAK